MKNLFPLLALALVVLFSVGCNKDDDDDGGGGTGGDSNDLTITLTWETVGADLDLSLIDPGFGSVGGGFSVGSNGISSGDDLEGPGEEVITFDDNAPDGQYIITVDAIDEDVSIPFTLSVQSKTDGREYNESIFDDPDLADDGFFMVIVVKEGSNLNFQ